MAEPTPLDLAMTALAGMMQQLQADRAALNPAREVVRVKPPTYDGHGDVGIFLTNFAAVAVAGNWTPALELLKLREVLGEHAQEAIRGCETAATAYAALRARYSLTDREARSRLVRLRRAPTTTVRDHADEVRRLSAVAYEGSRATLVEATALDHFRESVGGRDLNRHLVARNAGTLVEDVRVAEDWLRQERVRPGALGAAVVDVADDVAPAPTPVHRVETPVGVDALATMLARMGEQIERLTSRLDARDEARDDREAPAGRQRRGNDRPVAGVCYECGRPGHFAARCPGSSQRRRRSGN